MLLLILFISLRTGEQKSLLMMQETGSLRCLWRVLEKTWLASLVTVIVFFGCLKIALYSLNVSFKHLFCKDLGSLRPRDRVVP